MTGAPTSLVTAATARRLAVGALAAAVLGSSAGAALRPALTARPAPPAPQQIVAPERELSAMERAGGGWPALAPS